MSLDLTNDVRRGERREVDSATRVETIHGVDEADRPNLHEVLDALPPMREATRDRSRERKVGLDEPLPCRAIALSAVGVYQACGFCAGQTGVCRFDGLHYAAARL